MIMYDLLFVRIEQDFNYEDLANYHSQYLLADNNGKVLEYSSDRKKLEDIFNKNFNNPKVILIVPDNWVSFHLVDVPIKEYKKKIQAVPFLLEEKIISNIEDTLFILGPEISVNKHLVAVADKNKINSLLVELKKTLNVQADWVITDALCVYPMANRNNTAHLPGNNCAVYLNKNNNTGLVVTENIFALPLENLDILFDQFDNKVPIDIYKINSENVFNYLTSPKNIQKIVVNSEQVVHDWLPFLAGAWIRNKAASKRGMINLALGLHGSEKFDIRFHHLWLKTALIWGVMLLGFVGYKYYDHLVYSNININLNKLIKSELSSVDINTINLDEAEKLLKVKLNSVETTLRENRKKEKFYILLSAVAQNMSSKVNFNKINFSNEILELDFNFDQKNKNLIDKIKADFSNKKIILKETSSGTDAAGKTNNIIWTLEL